MTGVSVEHPRCPYCHDAIQPQQVKTPCMTCMAWHHTACAEEHERCAACGDRTAEGRSQRAVPRSRRVRHTAFHSLLENWREICASAARFASRGDLLDISHSHRGGEGMVVVWHGAGGKRPPPGCAEVAYRRFDSRLASWDELFQATAAFAAEVAPNVISISHSAKGRRGVVIVWYWA